VNYRYIPPELRELPTSAISHSADHRDFGRLAGKKIAVVGRGQSALESAALLHEHGAIPTVVARKPSILWIEPPGTRPSSLRALIPTPTSGIGAGYRTWVYAELPRVFYALPEAIRIQLVQEVLGPSGAWWLRDRIEGQVPVLLNHSIRGATTENGKVRLELAADGDGERELFVDAVVAATGYKVDLARLPFLGPELQKDIRSVGGAPVLSSCFESSVPGLYFIGLSAANSMGPVMRFVYGSRYAARRVTKHVSRKL
jgi:cation diffusion facilitator CzcD-associated flavoprotein CzcO